MRGKATRHHERRVQHNARETRSALAPAEQAAILDREGAITRAVNNLPIPETNFELLGALHLIGDNIWRMQPTRLLEWRETFLSRTTDNKIRSTFYKAIHPHHRAQVRGDIASAAQLRARAVRKNK